jgi:GNAT superfamily N-acetyltransferase
MYFNYTTFWPHNWWERRSFLHAWWRLYADDRQWTPPAYAAFGRVIGSGSHPLYERLASQPLYLEALPRRSGSSNFNPSAPVAAAVAFEEPVAATILQIDDRRDDEAAYLGLLRCANDEETLERLLTKAFEHVAEQGCGRLLGPTGIIPGWQPGVLLNHFNRTPPWHTPYNPPYAADLLGGSMEPWLSTVLYTADVPDKLPAAPAPAHIEPLALARLADDLLPLLAAALDLGDAFPACDELEARTLLAWLQTTLAPQAFLATVAGQPAGFVLLQPDIAPLLQRSGGGRGWLGRGYLALRKNARMTAGRLLLGAVAPGWRGRGIGLQLWQHALTQAQQAGWRVLTCGPVAEESTAAAFLQRQGAHAQQRYMTYSWSPW